MKSIASSVFLLLLGGCSITGEKTTDIVTNQMDVTIGSYGEGRERNLIVVTMVAAEHQALVENQPISTPTNEPSELPEKYNGFLTRLQNRYGLTRVADWPLAVIGVHCLVFETEGNRPLQELIPLLAQEASIETVQAMQEFNVLQSNHYNDPYHPLQHDLRSMRISAIHQWTKGDGVRVAIIDTGMELAHQDLVDSIELSRNFVDRNESEFSRDIHGTAIAGIIAANTNNKTGMVGIAPNSRLIALKSCWQKDKGSRGASCNTFTLAKALNFSIANDASVINLSLAGPRDPLLERLVKTALDKNVIVVGAVGPEGSDQFPTVVPGTIAVNETGRSATPSITAPGHNILSTTPTNEYDFFNGSSFSTAHVSGLAALARELNPDQSPWQLLELLKQTADTDTGAVDACRVMAVMMGSDDQECGALQGGS